MKHNLRAAIITVAVIPALAACGGDTVESDFEEGTTMARLASEQSITIGTKFDQPLFGLAGPDGTPVGFDVEIGKLVAEALGIPEEKIEWKETVSQNREPFIESGQVDIVVATYTINDTRKEVIDFAGPYYIAGQTFLVPAGNPDGIDGPESLGDNTVCTVTGSTSEKNVAEYTDNIITVDKYSDCLEPIRTGQAQALTTDNVILAGLVDQNEGEFELAGEPFTEEPYGIGLKKGDDEFRDFINDVLEQSYEDGSWAEAWESTAGKVLETPEPPAVDRY
ncbi:glutamate ABC transporter substrate-binding protein [Tessaracoccus sp. OS52]|uniref:glutamate ABC transporter substrate-binding protein n=1 Tax=Tessaracoccus sp. OS52 TaxID=2886691 RepID=UPI001D12A662|nr:glutamate ABC transporter substrate-binding protein [Tessaracoccus sp. OS52]MCC2593284.1 glutamate ABC transporter substrate-binding protein [Tessaracoccus sp. OS52]